MAKEKESEKKDKKPDRRILDKERKESEIEKIEKKVDDKKKKKESGKEINHELIEAYALENAIAHDGKSLAGNVLSALFSEGLQRDKIKTTMPMIEDIVKLVNKLSIGEQKKRFEVVEYLVKRRENRGSELPALPGAENGKVVMRLAPFPSGPLHLGNTRQAILNDEYVKRYNGKFILFIDDTIGSEEKQIEPAAYDLIPEGLKWLGINFDKKIMYKSDRLEIYYKYAEELIKKGYMYVCSCSREQMGELRLKGVECACRHLPLDLQYARWKEMFDAHEGAYTVRLKTNMQDPNPAFRDRVMFKISERAHPRVGKKYRVWPSMEFSWAIDDNLVGITHIIRGVELQMETRVENFIWDIFKWKKPVSLHTGLFTIEGVKLSKSKGAKEVHSGEYIGWNDPRLWSLQSLRDRGISPNAIREFCKNMGLTKNNSIVGVDVLYNLDKKYLEKALRYFFIPGPTLIKISGAPPMTAKIPLHPSENLGERQYQTLQSFWIAVDDYLKMNDGNYRLMHLLNFKLEANKVKGEKDLRFISEENDKSLNVKYIQWISADMPHFEVFIRMPDNSIVEGYGELAIENLKVGDIIQFERFGFVRLHALDKTDRRAEFWFAHK
jgi:glutamyl-tRNA synthetase